MQGLADRILSPKNFCKGRKLPAYTKTRVNYRTLRPFSRLFTNSFFEISFMRTLILTLVLGITLFLSCTSGVENPNNVTTPTPAMKLDTTLTNISISELNCWVERGQFFVVGICNNLSDDWLNVWLNMAPLDAKGKPITVNGAETATFPTFSDAVPPRGRTSFFYEWPLTSFPSLPDSCIVTGAGSIAMSPGAILVATEQSGVKMLVPATPGDTAATVEKAWQLSVTVENPLDIEAAHPRLELLLFGTDKRLWFASVLNPEDPNQKEILKAEAEGPMAPKSKRRFGTQVFYDNLPQALIEKRIGRVEYQPFNARF